MGKLEGRSLTEKEKGVLKEPLGMEWWVWVGTGGGGLGSWRDNEPSTTQATSTHTQTGRQLRSTNHRSTYGQGLREIHIPQCKC